MGSASAAVSQSQASRIASVIWQARAVLRWLLLGASLSRTSRRRPAGLPSRSGHTYLVRSGASRFSSDSLRSRHLTRSVALEKSRVTWKRPAVCVACGISPGTPGRGSPTCRG